ncbi:hypothetical protein [Streptomyces sp. NPDC058622]|uniref:hypothetical protein n=1 Tax=Streptomyces sp. NPDC058622 TaxID=3346562 RepID=UPI0036684941
MTLAAAGAERLVLDDCGVTFSDSTLLNLLPTLQSAGDLRLMGPLPRRLARLLAVTGAYRVLTTDFSSLG